MKDKDAPKGTIGVPVTLYYRTNDPKAALAMCTEDVATFVSLALDVEEKAVRDITHYEAIKIGDSQEKGGSK